MFLFVIFLIVGGEIVNVIAPLYYKQFFDVLSGAEAPSASTESSLREILYMVFALHLVNWVMNRTAGFLSTATDGRIMAELEKSAFGYLLGHSYKFFTNSFSGSLVRKVRRLSQSYATISENFKWTFLQTATVITTVLVILWSRSAMLSLILGAWVLLYTIASYGFSIWKLKYDERRSKEDSASTAVAADAISNSVNIMTFVGRTFEKGLFATAIEKWRKAQTTAWFLADGNEAAQWIMMTTLEFVSMLTALHYWSIGVLTIGDIVLVQSYLITIFIRVWDLGRTIRKTYEAVADAKEMVEIMETPHEIRDARAAKDLVVRQGKIVFNKVDFNYRKKRQVLDRMSLSINAREKVALVGPSGAGKSTVVKLLMRFHDIQRGAISIDGQNIAKVTQDSLREQISLVPQEAVLFHRSLMDNIRYGRRDATDTEVIEAAKQAHCHEFIAQLPEGYATFVGERGVKLSGGERQRVAIARAILKNAPILILDEATSSLDSESEMLIQDALTKLMKDKTTIVIAHRLSTILKMDRIVVMDQGKVVDSGTHAALSKKVGIYKKLWEIQAGGFIGE